MIHNRDHRQKDCSEWVRDTFGDESADSTETRAKRFIEEAIELAQACGLEQWQIDAQAHRVYRRPTGEPAQEVGGVGITLLSLSEALGVSADAEELKEHIRVTSKPATHWQARDAAKKAVGL